MRIFRMIQIERDRKYALQNQDYGYSTYLCGRELKVLVGAHIDPQHPIVSSARRKWNTLIGPLWVELEFCMVDRLRYLMDQIGDLFLP